MNKRIACLASLVSPGVGVIDVGTDHGYLPVLLAQRGYPGQILASDVNPGPLLAAKRTAEAAGLTERIQFLLCDGLSQCDPERVDTIVIAGMGGDTICGILDRAEWCMDRRYTLILQPMTRAEVLRYWLIHNEFAILREALVQDGGTLYTALVARFGGRTVLNEAELYTGAYSQINTIPLHEEWIALHKRRFQRALRGMEQGSGENGARAKILRLCIQQLEEMEDRDKSL